MTARNRYNRKVIAWQKRARWALAALAIGVLAVVAYSYRPREPVEIPKPIEGIDPKATVVTTGGDVIQLKGARKDLRLEFGRQATYADGQTTLFDVKVMVDNRGSRNYVITGKEARIGKDQSSFDLKGDVKFETSDGLVATAGSATYVDAEKIVRAPGPVTFTRGRMTGSGVGFTFDEQRDVLTILDQAVVHFAPEGDLGASDITAGTFIYARRDRYLRFERTMHLEREGQVIDAVESTVKLLPDRDEADSIELRGNASVTGSGIGALRSMTARDMNLDYGEDGRTLQHATLIGTSAITVATKDGSGTQTLAGEFMDIDLQPDGSVRNLSARERVVATLPATADTPARTVRSTTLTAEGNPQGLRSMTFQEAVEYREAQVKNKAGRVARSQRLEAGLEAASGALHEAHFTGNVDFTDGTLHATSAEARYLVGAGTLALFGKGQVPHIDSESLKIDADTIDITLNPRKMTAIGRVRSTMLPAKAGTSNAANRPGLLGDEEAVSIISTKLTYDETTRKAEYSGQTRLLQGQTSINAETLTLDETKGDLNASGKVVTNLNIADKSETAEKSKTKPAPTIGRAESFAYSDQTRKATYTTAAQFDGGQGNLRAAKIELQLAKDDNTLEQLEANGEVTAVVDKRTITGTRLTYSTSDEKYIILGAPVKMIDADCAETNGKTLTFWKGSDRVQVDGNDEVRTQTKGGGKCPAVPPQ